MRISDWSSDVCSSDLADDKSVRRIGLDALTHGLHDLQIDAQQVIAAHARLASDPGSNNDDVRASNVSIIVRALQVRIKAFHRAALGKIKRSEEHTSELQSLMRISYAVFCLKKKKK